MFKFVLRPVHREMARTLRPPRWLQRRFRATDTFEAVIDFIIVFASSHITAWKSPYVMPVALTLHGHGDNKFQFTESSRFLSLHELGLPARAVPYSLYVSYSDTQPRYY
jgi:hypothetical protein